MNDVAQRVVPLSGASNFRDLGGYTGRDGRPVRWRRLYRSDHLGNLTDADLQRLSRLGVRTALDFRGLAERAAAPNRLPGVDQHSLAIEPTVVQRMDDMVAAGHKLDAALAAALMTDLYRSLVNQQSDRFTVFFDRVLRSDGPLVFHCTAGKDRTGLAAALLLLALGVSREAVMADFLLTNQTYRHPPLPGSKTPSDALAVLWSVQATFLDTALQTIDAEHGGVASYLAQRLRLDRAALDELALRYLEPA